MTITLIHGGQTGVDRGAHIAALEIGWHLAGFMPQNGCDELGLIPRQVAKYLEPCPKPGYPVRTRMNVGLADALLLVVEDQRHPDATPGSRLTWDTAKDLGKPRWVIDPNDTPKAVAGWLYPQLQTHVKKNTLAKTSELRPFRLMVAGPRGSKWPVAQPITTALLWAVIGHMEAIHQGKETVEP